MNKRIEYFIELSMRDNGIVNTDIRLKQFDASIRLRVYLTEVPYGAITSKEDVHLYFKKKNGSTYIGEATDLLDDSRTVLYDLSGHELTEAGRLYFDVKIGTDDNLLSSQSAVIDVVDGTFTGQIDKSSVNYNEVLAVKKDLETDIETAKYIINDIEQAKDLAEAAAQNAVTSSDSAMLSATSASDSKIKSEEAAERAVASSNSALQSANSAEASKISAGDSAESASASANIAKSYAVGETGTRENEDSDNSKYYYEKSMYYEEKAKAYAENAAESLNEVYKKLELATFDLDENGNLIYTDNSSYRFTVDDNGYLNYSVYREAITISTLLVNNVDASDSHVCTIE